ncbi:flavodoxin family protein [Streptomyces gibsoniae]|uniref:Flavodoxin family protein n=1 Tax=Streptomyces gibsoniae TaxID=3075529 RepID=A0ABU2U7Q5_9ACTN|nr:flavodoxin family protein [Streptomyces sp. DSM 41699]MDT0469265.1 flavodoxin family protein [Streptomyces sp. DSM 41699]
MATVSVVYHSPNGHTRALAEHIARGVKSVPDVDVHLVEIRGDQVSEGRWSDPATMELLKESDTIVFGAPTYMGSVSAVFKAFLEGAFYPFLGQEWKDKLAGGFTHSASQNGDKLFSLQQLAVFAAQMNMQWISVGDSAGNNWTGGTIYDVNRLGSWLGVMGQTDVDEGPDPVSAHGDMVTAERYGTRLAELTARWVHGKQYEIQRHTLENFREISARSAAEAKARA